MILALLAVILPVLMFVVFMTVGIVILAGVAVIWWSALRPMQRSLRANRVIARRAQAVLDAHRDYPPFMGSPHPFC